MVKHNNTFPNVHLRKHWGRFVWTWFDQPARKHRSYMTRKSTAKKVFPRLRPIVEDKKFMKVFRIHYLISQLLKSFAFFSKRKIHSRLTIMCSEIMKLEWLVLIWRKHNIKRHMKGWGSIPQLLSIFMLI